MLVMPSNWSAGLVHYWAGRCPGIIGHLYSPDGFRGPYEWIPYALDNGAFTEFDERKWKDLLWKSSCAYTRPIWAAVPDCVGDKDKTSMMWEQYVNTVLSYKFSPAFVVQDGHLEKDIPKEAQVIFVGGSTKWKHDTISYWCDRFERVHVGRINTYDLIKKCYDAGAESCDGTGFGRGDSKQRVGLMRFLQEEEERRKMSTMTLEVTKEFDAAHSLFGTFPESHPCSRVHGHRYVVTIAVTGSEEDDVLVDYHDLHSALQDAVSKLDHTFLNDVLVVPTTCENLCKWFRDELRQNASCKNLSSVRVSEQSATSCILNLK